MLNNLKKVLGIEGLKIELEIPAEVDKDAGKISGKISMTTKRDTQVSGFVIKVMEKYTRGRGKNVLVNEYVMGQQVIQKHITVKKDESKSLDFEVGFQWMQSEMDKWQEQNFLYKGLIGIAKKIKGVKSEFYVIAEAKETGTKLAPHAIKPFVLQ